MDFRILGPLEVVVDGQKLPVGGGRQGAVLAVLLLHRGEVVSFDRLVDELWGERPPDTAVKTVQVYVSRLRKVLGEGVLVTRGGGYVVMTAPEEVDADRFERLAREGRQALEDDDPQAATRLLRAGLDLWRGRALDDFAYEGFARNEIARLEEFRLSALEDRLDAELACGRHTTLIPEIESLVAEHPTRERLRGQLMLGLYRSGRQADALESYSDARRALDRDLGLEPGPELQELQRAILSQDLAIATPARSANHAARTRRGGFLFLAGGALLLAAAVAAVFAITDGGGAAAAVPANSLAVIDPGSNDIVATVPIGLQPADVAADGDSIWVANAGDDSVTEVDAGTNAAVGTTSPGVGVAGLAAGAGAVWVGSSRGSEVVRMDPVVGSIRSIRIAPGPGEFSLSEVSPLTVGYGSVWAVETGGAIAQLDPDRRQVVDKISVGNSPGSIATGADAVWVTDEADNTITRIDPRSANAVTATAPVGQDPSGLAVGEDAVWVANTEDDTVARIDPETAGVVETIPVGRRPTGIATGEGAVWVANSLGGTVSRIDPETNRVVATIDVGEAPQEVTVTDDRVWVSVDAEAALPETPSPGSETAARMLLADDPGPDDPALGANPQILAATCAQLYNYPDEPFPAGARLRPEVARGRPAVSGDGRTYRFRLRSGFRFSPPSNEPVTAAAFERTIERVLNPRTGSYGGGLLRDVVGAKAYMAGRVRRLAGVTARANALVIRLTKPVPNLPERLSAPYFCAVPTDAPIDPELSHPLPSAGPYYVASHIPDQSLVLRRNPNYGGSRPSGLPEIDFAIGASAVDGIHAVEAGNADYIELTDAASLETEGAGRAVGARLDAQYGPQSEAARAGNQQFYTQPTPAVFSFAFNTVRGPFADVGLRRAVNYAIDRRALAEETGVGPPGRPTDQYIPPGIPGFEDALIYPLGGPDLAEARRLARDVERSAVLYTCSTASCTRQAQILRSNLSAIGIELEVRQFPIAEMFRQIMQPGGNWDVALWGWIVDYSDPYDFINTQFAAGADHPGGFHDPTVERWLTAASKLAGDARLRAYAKLDRDLADRFAPQATFASGETSYLLSARMGCEVLHPIYGLDLAALCFDDEG
jgi:YVTN family beta-propeller protein